MDRPLRILSLGAGVQSSTVLLMSCRGVLPRVDHAIFADTQWEPPQVYEALEWLEIRAEEAGIPVHRVTAGDLREHTMNSKMRGKKEDGDRYVSIPLRTLNADGTNGMIRRQCTREYKIDPIDKFIKRQILGIKKGSRLPTTPVIEKWFGISRDEIGRVREAHNKWETFVYPLIGIPEEYLDKPYTRSACFDWLNKNYPDFKAGKSACVGCPFRDNAGWREMKSNPVTWEDALEVDRKIRSAGGDLGDCYLHRSCVPLEDANLQEDQTSIFDDECMGYCGV